MTIPALNFIATSPAYHSAMFIALASADRGHTDRKLGFRFESEGTQPVCAHTVLIAGLINT